MSAHTLPYYNYKNGYKHFISHDFKIRHKYFMTQTYNRISRTNYLLLDSTFTDDSKYTINATFEYVKVTCRISNKYKMKK